MAKYLYNGQELNQLLNELKNIDEGLKASCEKANLLKSEIENCEWEGRSHDAMVAFMDLVVQYHNKLSCGDNPIDGAINEFQMFNNTLTDFYRNFPEYLKLSKI